MPTEESVIRRTMPPSMGESQMSAGGEGEPDPVRAEHRAGGEVPHLDQLLHRVRAEVDLEEVRSRSAARRWHSAQLDEPNRTFLLCWGPAISTLL
jgi:hypothetical protein